MSHVTNIYMRHVTQTYIGRIIHTGARTMPHSEAVSHVGTSRSYVMHINESYISLFHDSFMRDTPVVLLRVCVSRLIHKCMAI